MPIEQRGVDTIPEEERTSGPRDLVSILLGSNLCLGVIVFGWLPPSFGLGLWPSVTAIVVGTLVGIAFTAPLALVSLRTATNLSTSSGAQFGVRGRLIGSIVGLLLALGYTALTLWIGGDVMAGALSRLTGLPDTGATRAAMYGVLAACTVVGAVFGYRLLLRMSKVLSIGMVVLLAVGVFAYAPDFTAAAPPETPSSSAPSGRPGCSRPSPPASAAPSPSSPCSATTPATSPRAGTAPARCSGPPAWAC